MCMICIYVCMYMGVCESVCVCVLDGGVECKTHPSKIFPDTARRGLAEISLRICWGGDLNCGYTEEMNEKGEIHIC